MPFDQYSNYGMCSYHTSCPANFNHSDWWKVNPQNYTVASPDWGGTHMYAPPQGAYYNPYIGLFQTMKHYNPTGFRKDAW